MKKIKFIALPVLAAAVIAAVVVIFLLDKGGYELPKPSVMQPTETQLPTPTPTPPPPPIKSEQQAGSETGTPVISPTGKQLGVKCPEDYCLPVVKGTGKCPAWTGADGDYTEQECYDFPDSAGSLAECEKTRTIYYKICGKREG